MTLESPSNNCHWLVDGDVFTIHIERPEMRNALSPEVYRAITAGVTRAGAMSEIDTIVIKGTPGAFGVGGDLSVYLDLVESGAEEFLSRFQEMYDDPLPYRAMLDSPKTIVAAVDGFAVAGGTLIAAAADISIATERSRFGIPEARVGLADTIAAELLPRCVGLVRARYLLLTGRKLGAAQAAEWGLITMAVADEAELNAEVERVIADLRLCSPEAKKQYKRLALQHVAPMPARPLMDISLTPNAREGLRSFKEKRSPEWKRP